MRILNATMNGFNVSFGYRLLLSTIPTIGLLMVILISRLIGGPDWQWSELIIWLVWIFYAALIGVFVLAPFITTKSSFILRVFALVLASILIPPVCGYMAGSWTESSSWTWFAWSVYAALFGAFVLVAYAITKSSFNLRITALVLACLLITPIWELIEKGHGFFGFRPYLMIFDVVTINLLYAVVLIFAASLKVSRMYWLYTALVGIVGAFTSLGSWDIWGDYSIIITLLIWQLLFCTAVYIGKADIRRGVVDELETRTSTSQR